MIGIVFQSVIFSVLFVNGLHGQPKPVSPREVSYDGIRLTGRLPEILKEASGLQCWVDGILWTHNDDRLPVLYAIDTAGNILKVIHLNHPNNGWEDLARDQHGNVYIGAFGNNNNDRKNLAIYKISDPDKITDRVATASVIQYSYPDQHEFPPADTHKNFDMDAFVALDEDLFLFSKNRTKPYTGYTKVYKLPQQPGTYQAILHDSIYLGEGPMLNSWVTSADISPDGRHLVLLSHDCLWIVSDFQDKLFSEANILKINLNHFSHKAGVAFSTNATLYIVDELELGFLGGNVYSLDITPFLAEIDASTPGPLR